MWDQIREMLENDFSLYDDGTIGELMGEEASDAISRAIEEMSMGPQELTVETMNGTASNS